MTSRATRRDDGAAVFESSIVDAADVLVERHGPDGAEEELVHRMYHGEGEERQRAYRALAALRRRHAGEGAA